MRIYYGYFGLSIKHVRKPKACLMQHLQVALGFWKSSEFTGRSIKEEHGTQEDDLQKKMAKILHLSKQLLFDAKIIIIIW